jgi:hypothetical protein
MEHDKPVDATPSASVVHSRLFAQSQSVPNWGTSKSWNPSISCASYDIQPLTSLAMHCKPSSNFKTSNNCQNCPFGKYFQDFPFRAHFCSRMKTFKAKTRHMQHDLRHSYFVSYKSKPYTTGTLLVRAAIDFSRLPTNFRSQIMVCIQLDGQNVN